MNDRTSIVVFLAGGVTGAALTLLLAPQSGSATRERIRQTLRDTADSARGLTERVVQRGEEIGDEAAHRVHEAGSALAGHRPLKTRGNGDQVAATQSGRRTHGLRPALPLDINMLVATGSRERTRSEFAEVFARAGLKVKRVIPTACPLSIVEGVSA